MKKYFWVLSLLLLSWIPLACKSSYLVPPLPAFPPTPTATPLPPCGAAPVTLPAFVTFPVLPIPTFVPVPTFQPTVVAWPTVGPLPNGTPVPVPTHAPFFGLVVQTTAQWQTYFGSAPPPVNFQNQMILLYIANRCCSGSEAVQGACLTSTELDLSVKDWGAIPCNAICSIWGGVAVPATTLPVYVTQLTTGP